MFANFNCFTVGVLVFVRCNVTDQLVATQRMLTFAETLEVFRINFSLKLPCLGLSAEPFAFNDFPFAVIGLLSTGVFSFEVIFGLASGESLTKSHHGDCTEKLGRVSLKPRFTDIVSDVHYTVLLLLKS